MKKLISIFATLLIVSSLFAQDKLVFGFEGIVFIGTDKAGDVKVRLYDDNKEVSSYTTSRNGKFIIDTERNKHYTVQFEKDGYLTKRIIINTFVDRAEAEGVKEFKFDVSLIEKEKGKDYAILDFPIAIIEFHKISREFSYNRKYTNGMLEIQYDIMNSESNIASN